MSAALLALLAAATVSRVAIVPIVGTDDRVQTQQIVTAVAAAIEARVGLKAMSIDELFSTDGTALIKSINRCGTDKNCVRRSVRDFGADFAVVVVLNRRVTPPLVQIEIVPGASRLDRAGSKVGNVTAQSDEASTLKRLTSELLGDAGFLRAASIDLVVEPPDATVLLDDVPQVTAAEHRFQVQPGAHRVEAKREGYEPFSESKTLAEGETWMLRPVLKEQATSVLSSPWVWVATAAVVVAGAVTVGVVVAANQDPRTVRVCPIPCE